MKSGIRRYLYGVNLGLSVVWLWGIRHPPIRLWGKLGINSRWVCVESGIRRYTHGDNLEFAVDGGCGESGIRRYMYEYNLGLAVDGDGLWGTRHPPMHLRGQLRVSSRWGLWGIRHLRYMYGDHLGFAVDGAVRNHASADIFMGTTWG